MAAPDLPAPAPPTFPPVESLSYCNFPIYRPSEIVPLMKPLSWVWDGYLARGYVTLLTGWWKIGKSSLVSALIGRMGAGGEVAGRAVTPGTVLVVTEETAGPWGRRFGPQGIGDWAGFVYNPFVLNPVPVQWGYLFKSIDDVRRAGRLDLVVLDSLAALLPGSEETSARAMTAALRPVRDLAGHGVAVLLLHHPRKGAKAGGQAARGTGALTANVDTILEYTWAGPPTTENRRRRLFAWSRLPGAPREVVVELAADGTTYTAVPGGPADLSDETTRVVAGLVRATPGRTARELSQAWPADAFRPAPRRIQEALQTLTEAGHLVRTGRPHASDPYRYTWAADATTGRKLEAAGAVEDE